MKLVCLNTWAGTMFEPLMDFIREQSKDIDIFCFQEILNTRDDATERDGLRNNLYSELTNLLTDFQSFYYPCSKGHSLEGLVSYDIGWGVAIFIRKSINVKDLGERDIYRKKFESPGEDLREAPSNLQAVSFQHNDKELVICNLHGLWWPGEKLDDQNRLEQSKKILDFLKPLRGEKILCGDFNLMPETESIRMIEQTGLGNLIKEFEIKDTRGPINRAKYTELSEQSYSDYIFVSKGIKVVDFQVPEVAISDHLPLILEFE